MRKIQWKQLPAGHSRWAVVVAALFLAFTVSPAWAEITTLSSAINKAGRQRMLSQRIVKAYALVGMEVQTRQHRVQLDEAIALFDSQLAELKAFAPTKDITAGLERVGKLWAPFKELAGNPKVTRDDAAKLLAVNDELLGAAHEVVVMLEKESGTSFGRLVNIAGRQRMLSQRLAKFYMFRAWGFDDPKMLEQMKVARDEFDLALNELITANENSPAIQAELQEAAKQWGLYQRGLQLEKDEGNYIPLIMAVTSEKMLTIMNKITGMYEQLSAR